MKVSIVTVSFNSAETIADTLRSVGSQANAEIEHIVVDGGSSDATAELVVTHGTHVSRFISEPDAGIYDAMNKGLALASGEWIGFLNADDMYADDAVIALVTATADRTHADAIYGDLTYVAAADVGHIVRYWRSGEFSRPALRRGWMPPHPSLFVRTQLLRDIGGFDTGFRIAADYDCALRLFARERIRTAYIARNLVRMRLGGVSNRSLRGIYQKSMEDLRAIRQNQMGGTLTLLCKNARKLRQVRWSSLMHRPQRTK